jgi:hypothetical protein
MKYLGIALLISIVSGVIHNLILFRHVMPYMKKRGSEPQGLRGAFRFGKIISEYFKTDDPDERSTKIILRYLKVAFLFAYLILAFGMYVLWTANAGK